MGLQVQKSCCDLQSVWQLLALTDDELESTDLVGQNLLVAREIPSLHDLDIPKYCQTVDEWTHAFARWLPGAERTFHQTPWKWRDDIRFFRVGMLAGFLGHEIGIRYIDEQKHAKAVYYTDPGQLFLNGLIDTKQGTCGNMAALHVAMSRKMGWAVSLACVASHFLSRYDDGEVIHNIEATQTDHPGTFSSDTDEWYANKYNLPKKATVCGSDLRRLTAREMVGAFISLRGRHFTDVGDHDRADLSFTLSRVLFPTHRRAYVGAMIPMLKRGEQLFEPNETGHPSTLLDEQLLEMFAPPQPVNGPAFPMARGPLIAPLGSPFSRSTVSLTLTEGKTQ